MSNLLEFLASPKALVMDALPLLADAAVKGAIVIGAAALVVLVLRRRSAATRHAVWAGAVAAQLALPALAALLPAWRVPLFPAMNRFLTPDPSHVFVQVPSDESGRDMITIGPLVEGRPMVANTRPRFGRPAWAARGSGHASAGAVATARGFGVGFGRGGVQPELVSSFDAPRPSRLLRVVAVVWLLGCLAVFGRFIAGTIAVWRLSRTSDRVDDGPWLSLAQRIANALGVKRPLTLLRSGRFGIPVTWGVVYPVVLLPADADDWHEQRRQYVLVHEMAHVKRVDAFTQLLAQVALAIFWFNPLVWLAVHRMRVEREHACDDYVLRQGTAPSTYASDLLEMVRARWREEGAARTAFAALAMARPGELEARMLAILDPEQDRRALPNTPALAVSLGALAMLLPLAAFSPFASREPHGFGPTLAITAFGGVETGPDMFAPLKDHMTVEPEQLAALKRELAIAMQAASAREAFGARAAELAQGARELAAARIALATTGRREESCDAVRLRKRGSSASTSIHTDDEAGERAHFQYRSTSAGRCLEVTIIGVVEFSSDERAVRGVSRGGRLYLHERLVDSEHELTISRGDDGLEYDYAVDGRRAEFDASGQDWLAEVIPEVLRESGLNARQRVARIRKEDGVRGVLAEIERTGSNGAKRTAYTALLDQGTLSESELDLILSHASRDLSSSDGDMRAVLEQIARSAKGRLSPRASESVGAAVARMSSDGEKRVLLQQYASFGDRGMLLMAMRHAKELSSDGEKATLLRALAPHYLGVDDDALRQAFFSVSETISSDGERRSVLMAALEFARVSPAVALGVIESSSHMSSDGEKAEVLVSVARLRLFGTPGVRDAFMRATRSISSDGDYRRVMEVALQQ